MVRNVIAKNLTHSYQSYKGLTHGKKRNEDYEHEEEKARRMTARCGVCVCPPPPLPPKESSLPPSAGSAGFSFYITRTRAGSWAAWGHRGDVGGPEGTRRLPPAAPRQASLRHRPPRSARDGAAPGAASARPGGEGGRGRQPPEAPSERTKWPERANSGKGERAGG